MLSALNLLNTLRHSLKDFKHIILHESDILELIFKASVTTSTDNIFSFFQNCLETCM